MKKSISTLVAIVALAGCSSDTGNVTNDQSTASTSPSSNASQSTEVQTDFSLPDNWPTSIPLPVGAQLLEDATFSETTFGEPGSQMQTVSGKAKGTVRGAPSDVYSAYSKQLNAKKFKCGFQFNSDGSFSCDFKNGTYSVTVFIFDANKDGESAVLEGYSLFALTIEYQDGVIELD